MQPGCGHTAHFVTPTAHQRGAGAGVIVGVGVGGGAGAGVGVIAGAGGGGGVAGGGGYVTCTGMKPVMPEHMSPGIIAESR